MTTQQTPSENTVDAETTAKIDHLYTAVRAMWSRPIGWKSEQIAYMHGQMLDLTRVRITTIDHVLRECYVENNDRPPTTWGFALRVKRYLYGARERLMPLKPCGLCQGGGRVPFWATPLRGDDGQVTLHVGEVLRDGDGLPARVYEYSYPCKCSAGEREAEHQEDRARELCSRNPLAWYLDTYGDREYPARNYDGERGEALRTVSRERRAAFQNQSG